MVLVDEYDKPILDALEAPETARRNRDLLRGLYGTIKDCDAHVRFSFLAGVSRFSKAGLFSGLNNPEDLTLNPRCSALCGYTEADLETVFAPELPGLDRERIRRWYDGYNWLGPENVYNPCDVLLLFRLREFEAHWFETGTPAFLVNLLRERRVSTPALESMTGDRALLSRFDVGDVGTEALLFQSGYLTIKGVDRDAGGTARYRLGYPNQEVRQSLNESLLGALAPNASAQLSDGARFRELFAANDFSGLKELIQAHFDGIPHQWHASNDIADYNNPTASAYAAAPGAAVAQESGVVGQAGGPASSRTRSAAGPPGCTPRTMQRGCRSSRRMARRQKYSRLGAGVGFTDVAYVMSGLHSDAARITSGADLPNADQIARNLAGTVYSEEADLHDTMFGYQVLFGVDYALAESVSLGVKGRWGDFGSFDAFRDGGTWDRLRSHESNLRLDGSEPVAYEVEFDGVESFGVGLALKYHF